MTRSSKAANRNSTPAIASRIGARFFFQPFMGRVPDCESTASLIADVPPRLAVVSLTCRQVRLTAPHATVKQKPDLPRPLVFAESGTLLHASHSLRVGRDSLSGDAPHVPQPP